MKTTTHAYETLHATHSNYHETYETCPDCRELLAKQEAHIEAQIDQAREDREHKH